MEQKEIELPDMEVVDSEEIESLRSEVKEMKGMQDGLMEEVTKVLNQFDSLRTLLERRIEKLDKEIQRLNLIAENIEGDIIIPKQMMVDALETVVSRKLTQKIVKKPTS